MPEVGLASWDGSQEGETDSAFGGKCEGCGEEERVGGVV